MGSLNERQLGSSELLVVAISVCKSLALSCYIREKWIYIHRVVEHIQRVVKRCTKI